MVVGDTPTVVRTLHKDHDQLACSVELLAHGLQVHIAINGRTPYHSRTFQTQDELLTRTADERARCLAEGWS